MGNDAFARTGAGYFQQINQRLTSLERRLPPSFKILAGRGLRDDGGAGTGLDPKTLMNLSGTTAERDALFPAPATDPDRVTLANLRVQWYNIEYGWMEQYYAVTGLSGLTAKGLITGTASGWYPVGLGPFCVLEPSTTFSASSGSNIGGWNGVVRRNGGAAWFGNGGSGIDFVQAGRYDFGWWTNQQTGSGQADYHTRLRNASDTVTDWMSNVSIAPLSALYLTRAGGDYHGQHVRAGQQLKVLMSAGTLNVHDVSGGTTYPSSRGEMWARYVGPALVSD